MPTGFSYQLVDMLVGYRGICHTYAADNGSMCDFHYFTEKMRTVSLMIFSIKSFHIIPTILRKSKNVKACLIETNTIEMKI